MTDDIKREAIRLYDRFTHGAMQRRAFMTRMIALTGSVAAANALLWTIAARAEPNPWSPTRPLASGLDHRHARASQDPRVQTYVAEPRRAAPPRRHGHPRKSRPQRHTRESRAARRFRLHRRRPDFLSPVGGTRPTRTRRATHRQARSSRTPSPPRSRCSRVPRAPLDGSQKVAWSAFCWAAAWSTGSPSPRGSKLDAGVVYYGPALRPAKRFGWRRHC